MADEALKVGKLALLYFIHRAVAFRTRNRHLPPGWFAGWFLNCRSFVHIAFSVIRIGGARNLAAGKSHEDVRDLREWQTKIDIDAFERGSRHARIDRFGRILDNSDTASRFDAVKSRRAVIESAAQDDAG